MKDERWGLKEFFRGKMAVEDNLNEDFIHGFVSALVWLNVEQGMSPWLVGLAQQEKDDLVTSVVSEIRRERMGKG